MKYTGYSILLAALSEVTAGKLTPAKKSPALHAKDLSPRPRNNLEARSYDYCGLTSYYCIDSICCGTTWYNCMPSDAECCGSMVATGEGLWCESGSSCTVVGGYVMCKDSDGDTFSAGSTALGAPSSSAGYSASQTVSDTTYSGSSSSSHKSKVTKKKSKAWIAAAAVVPLIGIAIIGGVVFFLTQLRKKKRNNAAASAAVMANNQGGAPGDQPAMSTAPPPAPMPPLQPMQQQQMGVGQAIPNPDSKTPAYTYQHEVPTPISSPPPQWTPANPNSAAISPAPTTVTPVQMTPSPPTIPPPQANNGMYGMNSAQPMYAPQPMYGNATELPSQHATPAPRGGAHEIGG